MEAVSASQNGALLNLQAGQHGSNHGLVTGDDLRSLGAQPVNPNREFKRVFVFPIHNALEEGRAPYDAARCCWDVAAHWRDRASVAVGVARGLAKGSWGVPQDAWTETDDGKWKFEGKEFTEPGFSDARWLQVINAARGYWQRGNYLIVAFDGKGRFRIDRGSSNKEWQPLV